MRVVMFTLSIENPDVMICDVWSWSFSQGWNQKLKNAFVCVLCSVQWKPLLQCWQCEVQWYRPMLGSCHEEKCVPGVSGKCRFLIPTACTPLFTHVFFFSFPVVARHSTCNLPPPFQSQQQLVISKQSWGYTRAGRYGKKNHSVLIYISL